MGFFDNLLNNKAFQLGAGLLANNTGHYGQFGPALGGAVNYMLNMQQLQNQVDVDKIKKDALLEGIDKEKKQKEWMKWLPDVATYGTPEAQQAYLMHEDSPYRDKAIEPLLFPEETKRKQALFDIDLLSKQAQIERYLSEAKYYNSKAEHPYAGGGAPGTSEFERMLDRSGITPEEKQKLIRERITKLVTPDMSSLVKDFEFMKKEEQKFRSVLENYDGDLSSIDIRKLTPEQRAAASRLGNAIIRAEKPANQASIAKGMEDINMIIGQVSDALETTRQLQAEGKDVNLLPRAIRDYWSKYFGLSDEQLKSVFRDMSFQGASNRLIKIISGATVTDQEWNRAKTELGTLWQTNETLALGMRRMVDSVVDKLDAMKATMGPVPFNLKFGGIYRNATDLAAMLGDKPTKDSNYVEVIGDDIFKKQGGGVPGGRIQGGGRPGGGIQGGGRPTLDQIFGGGSFGSGK